MRQLTDLEARQIADAWHGGMMTGLYALQSTGAIVTTFMRDPGPDDDTTPIALYEVKDCLEQNVRYPQTLTPQERDDLESLRAYILAHGPRGPIDGWATRLTW